MNELETDAKNLTILSEYMYDSCSINCKAARSVKAYVKDVHISAVSPYILNAIDVVRTITTEYFYEMYEIDNGEDSVIQEEHLENLEGKLYGLKNKACEILFELEKYAEAISDIMDVTTKSAEELEPYLDEQKLIVTKLKNEFALYESERLEEAKTAQEVINGFYTKVSNYGNDNLDITKYDGEYYIEPLPTEGLPEVEQLYDELGYNDEENAIDTLGEVGGIIWNSIIADMHIGRVVDESLDGDLLEKVKNTKDKLPTWAKNKKNFGYSEVTIEGVKKTCFFAHSSIQTAIPSMENSGISLKPEASPFKTASVNKNYEVNGEGAWPRDVDVEYKILSDIQSELGDNYSVTGKIVLYTELEPCPSCCAVIVQFKEMYPNIDIEVIYSMEK